MGDFIEAETVDERHGHHVQTGRELGCQEADAGQGVLALRDVGHIARRGAPLRDWTLQPYPDVEPERSLDVLSAESSQGRRATGPTLV